MNKPTTTGEIALLKRYKKLVFDWIHGVAVFGTPLLSRDKGIRIDKKVGNDKLS